MKEADITRKILRALRAKGGFWFKIHGGPYQAAGIPDIIGCFRGTFYGLEVKRPERKRNTTQLQLHTLNAIRLSGGVVGVVTSVKEAVDLVDSTNL